MGPPDLPNHLFLSLGLFLCLLCLGYILGSDWRQRLASPGYPAHSVPTPPKPTHLPEDDTGVTGASEGAVVQPAAVQPPDLVVVGIQRPHTLIVFDGPELHEPIGATGLGGVGRGLSTGPVSAPHNPCPVSSPLTWRAAVCHGSQRPPSAQKHRVLRTSAGLE